MKPIQLSNGRPPTTKTSGIRANRPIFNLSEHKKRHGLHFRGFSELDRSPRFAHHVHERRKGQTTPIMAPDLTAIMPSIESKRRSSHSRDSTPVARFVPITPARPSSASRIYPHGAVTPNLHDQHPIAVSCPPDPGRGAAQARRLALSFIGTDRFEAIGKVGSGSFGEVFKVRAVKGRGYYAVKKTRRRFRGSKDRDSAMGELRALEQIGQSPFCVQYFRSWNHDGALCILMELCDRGTLEDYLMSRELPEKLVWAFLADMVLAVHHIHSKGIVHLDLKPANIFLSSNGKLKIGDFGIAVKRQPLEFQPPAKMSQSSRSTPQPSTSTRLSDHNTKFRDPTSSQHSRSPVSRRRTHPKFALSMSRSFPLPITLEDKPSLKKLKNNDSSSTDVSHFRWGANFQKFEFGKAFPLSENPVKSLIQPPPTPDPDHDPSQVASSSTDRIDRDGDPVYLAPEALNRSLGPVSFPADIFSLGMILLEMAADVRLPPNGEEWQKLRSEDLSFLHERAVGWTTRSRELRGIVKILMRKRPCRRPTAHALRQGTESKTLKAAISNTLTTTVRRDIELPDPVAATPLIPPLSKMHKLPRRKSFPNVLPPPSPESQLPADDMELCSPDNKSRSQATLTSDATTQVKENMNMKANPNALVVSTSSNEERADESGPRNLFTEFTAEGGVSAAMARVGARPPV
ncbi:hypothetical protein AAMO2058_000964900 [Amorphochlora amoebiformis]|mmetsp:Transcript_13093/g.20766  ORF Transcript_13093/g.20766 Transcript_13093/m.20766 type:complete len:687 (-) Transcript_13093:160-2220(-)